MDKDSTVYKRDTLHFQLSYLRTDSTGMQSPYLDTVKMVFTDKKVNEKAKRRKKDAEKPVIDFLKMTASVDREQDVNTGIFLEFDRPVTQDITEHVQLLEKSIHYMSLPILKLCRTVSIYGVSAWKRNGNPRRSMNCWSIPL